MRKFWSMILTGICLTVTGEDGIRKFTFGDLEVTAIQDAANAMPVSIFGGGEIQMKSGTVPASVNVFLIQNGKDVILVDSGYGGTRGTLLKKLGQLKIAPEMITAVLLTHTHFDHVGGLTADGRALFPNAKIYISVPEYEFGRKSKSSSEILKEYGRQLYWFRFDEKILPGITACSAVGHTPGHTVFKMGSLCFIGDLIHGAALQFENPDICAKYDMDTEQAVRSRRAILKKAAEENAVILGAHLPFPGVGHVKLSSQMNTAGKAPESFLFLPCGKIGNEENKK